MTSLLSQLERIRSTAASIPSLTLVQVVVFVFRQALVMQKSWRLMADMIRSLKQENRQRVIKRRDAVESIVRDTLTQSVLHGLIPEQNTKLASLQLFSMAEGMSGWYRENGPNRAEEIIAHASRFFLRAISARPEVLDELESLLEHA